LVVKVIFKDFKIAILSKMDNIIWETLNYVIIFAPLLLCAIGALLIWKFKKHKQTGKIIFIIGFILLIIYISAGIYFFNNLVGHNDCD
jgi:cytochrome bd-type quinol oxidase subunit 2